MLRYSWVAIEINRHRREELMGGIFIFLISKKRGSPKPRVLSRCGLTLM